MKYKITFETDDYEEYYEIAKTTKYCNCLFDIRDILRDKKKYSEDKGSWEVAYREVCTIMDEYGMN